MKKITICAILLITTIAGFSQQNNPSPTLTKYDYLKKSNRQRFVSYSLFSAGAILITTGFISLNHTVSKGEKESLLIINGLVITIVSIPLFVSSQINKKKSMTMSFKSQELPQLSNGSFVYKQIPSISFKINL